MVCIIPKLVPRDISWRKCFLGGASATGFPGADLKACRSQVCSRDTGVRAISRFLFSIRLLSNAATACAASLGALSVVMAPKSPSMPLPPRAFLLCHGSLFPQQGNSRLLTSPSDSCSSVTCWSFFCPFLYKIYSISDWFPRKPSLKNRNRLGGKQNTPKIPLCNVQ